MCLLLGFSITESQLRFSISLCNSRIQHVPINWPNHQHAKPPCQYFPFPIRKPRPMPNNASDPTAQQALASPPCLSLPTIILPLQPITFALIPSKLSLSSLLHSRTNVPGRSLRSSQCAQTIVLGGPQSRLRHPTALASISADTCIYQHKAD